MGVDPASLALIGLVIGGGAAAVGVSEQIKTRKSAEKQFKKQEEATASQLKEAREATASQLEDARKSESDAKAAAAKKVADRKAAIQAGGRPSTFAANAFGLRTDTDIRKKTLG